MLRETRQEGDLRDAFAAADRLAWVNHLGRAGNRRPLASLPDPDAYLRHFLGPMDRP
jgi:hypothetical protein